MIVTASFARFGSAHLCIMALTFIAPLVLSAITCWDNSGATARIVGWFFVAFLVGSKIISLIVLHRDGQITIESVLPMHLCDWAAIMVLITFIHPNQWTYELCYFWGLGGTLQALVTPDLPHESSRSQTATFFALHGGVIASLLYMTLGMRMRPVPISILRVLAWSTLYLGAAAAVNSMLGTNFGYLRAKPAQPSLMDYLAPWPFYIAELVLLAIAFVLVLYAPFFVADRLW